MADNAILYKFLAKSVGMKYGITPSFMAKPWANVSSSSQFTLLTLDISASSLDVAGMILILFSE